MPWNEPLIAASRSASGRMTFALLPPSSSVTRLRPSPHLRPISRPTAVEPVKATLFTPGWSTSAAPVSPSPGITLTTPSGKPASATSWPRRSAVRGVCSAGFRTTVQPAAAASSSPRMNRPWGAAETKARAASESESTGVVGMRRSIRRARGLVIGAVLQLALVPALQSWTASHGTFELRPHAHVVVRAGEPASLRAEARTLAADLGARVGSHTRRGDVVLTLSARDKGLGGEGYWLRIGRVFTIAARRDAGIYYGGRTLLQMRRLGGGMPRGRARDYPLYSERGMMLDDGRAFYSRAWLMQLIRELSDLKLNLLHLHFSDDQGFRIESDTHPEIVTK